MKNKYQHLLFDLDRTIWDFEKNSKEAIKEIYSHFKIDKFQPDFEIFFNTYHAINEELWEKYRIGNISKKELSETRFANTFKTFGFDGTKEGKKAGEMYLELSVNKTHTFEGAHETINYLSKSYELHILTNGFKEVQERKLINCNLRDFFSTIITSEDAGYQKPDLKIFEFAFEQTGANNQNTIMIGDDESTDIAGAKNARMDSIWFNPEGKAPKETPNYQVKTLPELTTLL
ncbi:MAG: noncanonical pyrimidine nucleotidase, YjjG family [Salinivirgaceae bacterium]|nr:MAG: noncanonical pyrimidine nucleotidase, YjjG family [Salinivirgaceae bacterium]